LKFSLSPIDEQKFPRINELISIIYASVLEKDIKPHMSRYGAYEDHNFIDESTFIEDQDGIFNHLEMSCHEFHDPMAFYMELYFSKVSNAPVVGKISDYNCKYQFLLNLLLQNLYHLRIVSNSCMEEIIFISSILT
jgi:hypothetical protein